MRRPLAGVTPPLLPVVRLPGIELDGPIDADDGVVGAAQVELHLRERIEDRRRLRLGRLFAFFLAAFFLLLLFRMQNVNLADPLREMYSRAEIVLWPNLIFTLSDQVRRLRFRTRPRQV